jgi:predicted nucleic acid-binding protein
MRLIINTNRIIAALIKDSYSRKIIMSGKFELVTISFASNEIKKHKREILDKTNLSEIEFDNLLSIFLKKIYVIDDIVINSKTKEARKIMDNIDPDDSPFIALALSIKNDGIWSDDMHFSKQNVIKVWRTDQLFRPVVLV